jgi:hypothetical protein
MITKPNRVLPSLRITICVQSQACQLRRSQTGDLPSAMPHHRICRFSSKSADVGETGSSGRYHLPPLKIEWKTFRILKRLHTFTRTSFPSHDPMHNRAAVPRPQKPALYSPCLLMLRWPERDPNGCSLRSGKSGDVIPSGILRHAVIGPAHTSGRTGRCPDMTRPRERDVWQRQWSLKARSPTGAVPLWCRATPLALEASPHD